MRQIERRRFIGQAAGLVSGFGLAPPRLTGGQAHSYGNEFPDMLVAHLAAALNELAGKGDAERARIQTPAQAEARNRFVREKFREMIQGFPERTPLAPVTVTAFERSGYRVENVMFQSRPNFWVTGNLYIPTGGSRPYPGIISPCGHYPLARMEPEYQFAYMDLVLSGFVVLAYDPIGQGERRQYWNPQTDVTEVGSASTYEHSMPGQALLLMGEILTQYMIWDGMRAIDYLLTRPEVDKSKIGCAGHSGGATLTGFIGSLDERVQCVAINEGGTGHRWPIGARRGGRLGPSDIEQNLFPAAVHGIDICDVWASVAPRPLLLTIESYSPAFNLTAGHLKARYELFNVPEKFATEAANDAHSWTMKLRLATADWFSRWFYDRRGPEREPNLVPESKEKLYCALNGSLRYAKRGETIFSLMLKKSAGKRPPRPVPANLAELDSFRSEMEQQVRSLLHYEGARQPLGVRHIVTTPRRGYNVETVEFLSEPGVYIPAWVFVPDKRDGAPPTIFVDESGKQIEGQEFGLFETLARKGRLIVAVDVRGIGETAPAYSPGGKTGEFAHLFDVETAMTYMAWHMDRSLFGMRVSDVVRSVEYALSRPDAGARTVRVVGKGAGALWCLFAAVLEPRIGSVIAENGLLSYGSLTAVDRYRHGAAIFIPNMLVHFDLPQVAGAIAGRELAIVSPVDAMKRPVDLAVARKTYAWTVQAFRSAGAGERFRVVEDQGLF